MYISDLEIYGFKSFAQKTKFKFSKGLTCVVGPNGCGKTNVVDAIRWVMGEQKSSLLRSDKMTDVIFAGSKYKKPLNYAEVSLTIHNDRGVLPIAYTDVVISRRLFRDGTSEYILNGSPVRLKDILDLFADTGMSSDVYSVIELKMVEDILSDNKESRKRLFEEASGISKYKSQRKSSYRKLDATRDDLNRLEDIIYEIDKKVGALKRQLKRYEKYQEYIDELRDMEILYGQIEYEELNQKIVPLQDRLHRNQNAQTETGQQLSIEEAMLVRYKEELVDLENELAKLDTTLNELNSKLNVNHSATLVWNEKIRNAGENIRRLNEELDEARTRKEANESIRDEISQNLNSNDPQINKLKEKLEQANKELKICETQYAEIDHEGQIKQTKLMDIQTASQQISSGKIRLEDQKNNYSQIHDEAQVQVDTIRNKGQEKAQQLKEILKNIQYFEEIVSQKQAEKQKLFENKDKISDSIDNLKSETVNLKSQLQSTENEILFYKEILDSMEGFNPGVKYTLKEIKHPRILGTVADLFKVDEKFSSAIEIALGNAAKFLVSETKDAALDIIDELKAKKRGRVTIVPLDVVKNRIRSPKYYDYRGSNVIGFAKDFVKTESGADLLIDFFLNDLMLVHSLRDIPERVLNESPYRFVTPDGDYIEKKGFIKGGKSSRKYNNIIGRKEKIEQLGIQENELKTLLEKKEDELQVQRYAYTDSIAKLSTLEQELGNSQQELRNNEKQRDEIEFESQHDKQSILDNEDKISKYTQLIHDINFSLKELEKEQEKILDQIEIQKEELHQYKSQHEDILNTKDRLSQNVQQAKIELITQEREKENVQFRFNNAIETIEDLNKRIEENISETQGHKAVLEDGNQSLETLSKEQILLREEFDSNNEKRREHFELLTRKKDGINKTEQNISQQHRERENVFQTLKDIELKLADIILQQKQVKEKIFDKYHIDISLRIFEEPDMPKDEIEELIQKFHRRIELIGPINMAVKLEYEEESARLQFLQEQQKDLLEAEQNILETITKLDTEARKQFIDVFDQVRKNFNQTFTLFFPNGAGDIKLSGSSDPLEAEIEIFARPKSKDLKSLKSLSGGEKALTAISLLFSIYLVKPSPYCILDEVDAPLDDQNISRFTKALRHFTDNTQFIIVTHNKLTMEAADYMYGVTMQEEGVSKVVSVQFKEN